MGRPCDLFLLMNIPRPEIRSLSPVVKEVFLKWNGFMYRHVRFNRPDSEIHAANHCERVLLFALLIGEKIFGDDREAFEILAHASIFHDTRRENDYLDTGHGARAAVYYEKFCKENGGITFHPESVFLMCYHDLADSKGREAISERFGENAERVLRLYSIFKDADALDRWRLGSNGLDPEFLRTLSAKTMLGYSRRIVRETIAPRQLRKTAQEVDRILRRQKSKFSPHSGHRNHNDGRK